MFQIPWLKVPWLIYLMIMLVVWWMAPSLVVCVGAFCLRWSMVMIRSLGEIAELLLSTAPAVRTSGAGKMMLITVLGVGLWVMPFSIPLEHQLLLSAILSGYVTSSLERFIILQCNSNALWAFEARRGHLTRPPPEPDPELSKRKIRAIRRAFVEELRARFYARRLRRKRLGKTVSCESIVQDEMWALCKAKLAFFYIPQVYGLLYLSPLFTTMVGSLVQLILLWILFSTAVNRLIATWYHNYYPQATRPVFGWRVLLAMATQCLMFVRMGLVWILMLLYGLSMVATVDLLRWNTSADGDVLHALVLLFLSSSLWLLPSRSRVWNGVLGIYVVCCSGTAKYLLETDDGGLSLLQVLVVIWRIAPRVQDVLSFVWVDIPSAFSEAFSSSEAKHVSYGDPLYGVVDDSEHFGEESIVRSLTAPPPFVPKSDFVSKPPPDPPPPNRTISCSDSLVLACAVVWRLVKWLLQPKRAVIGILGATSLRHQSPTVSNITLKAHYTAISTPIDLSFSTTTVSITRFRLLWRERRRLRRQMIKLEHRTAQILAAALPSAPVEVSETELERLREARFVSKLNPATHARQWLSLDPNAVPPDDPHSYSEEVSVDLGLSKKPSRLVLAAAVESAFNSLGQLPVTPLIIDTGASCCISPHQEDFVTYADSAVKIKDLSGVNKVAGEGMLEWKVLDKSGHECTISIRGYHMPGASVRLLSPQCLYNEFKGVKANHDADSYAIRLLDGSILDAPHSHANLPILPMSDSTKQPSCLWMRCFSFQDVTPDLWTTNVLAAKNQNITNGQRELLRWHHKLAHAGLSTIHNLCRQKREAKVDTVDELKAIREGAFLPCTFNVPACSCDGLLCAACETANATRRAPSISGSTTRADKEMVTKEGNVNPGDCISCDHFSSPVKGRVMAPSGHSSSAHGYTCGTIFVDHCSGHIFVHPQKTNSAQETIRSKLLVEREAADIGVKIKAYHSDNGVFNSAEFKSHCEELDQVLTFSGVGAKFQNGVAEQAIGRVCSMARATMLHATMCWPGRKFIDLWPLAMQYAVWVHNRLPPSGAGWSPEELWANNKRNKSELPRAHTFGCPVYVLDPKLQDGKKIPKWDSRARQGIFVGFSPNHSSNVALVLNPRTQHISPQYHVVFDDDFTTVPAVSTELSRNQEFERLYETSRERYIDPKDAGAREDLDDDELEPPSHLLGDEWLTSTELEQRQAIRDSSSKATEEATEQISADPEGALADDPEGELPAEPEGASDDMQADDVHGVAEGGSGDISSEDVVSSDSGTTNSSLPKPPDSPPALRTRLRRNESRPRGLLVTGLLALQQHALSSVWEWGQLPPDLSNTGRTHTERCPATRVQHGKLFSSYLLQGSWDDLGREACMGKFNAFSSYFEPDLSDDLEAFTVTNVQPHMLEAHVATNDPDNPSFNAAINGPFQEKWWEAMELEINTLENDLQAWELVPRDDSMKNILPSTWAFKIKRFPDGLVKKFKARFCVRGDMQKEGIDFFETWSPVVQWTTVRSMMILAANQNLVTAQADITAAFVHAELKPKEHIYVHQPAGFRRGSNMVLKLKKSVYGLRQAPRYFFEHLKERLESSSIGLVQSERDPCLFVGKSVIVVVYVDDILFFAKDDGDIQHVIDELKKKGVAIRREGTAEGFLGVDIERTTTAAGKPQIVLKQTGLTGRIITALGLDGSLSTRLSTPAEVGPLPKDVNGEPAVGNINYAAVVGMLLYLSGHSRPDIAFAVHQVARYTFKPTRRHEQALIRIGRYLKGTRDKGLIMSPTSNPQVDCYPDADFAGLYGHEDSQDPHCARSRTGYVILAFGCPVVWRSNLQTEIALSTMEAEYVALSTACKDLIPVVGIIRDLSAAVGLDNKFTSKLHIKIHEDNVGALTLANLEPRRMTPRSKHYAIKYHWFREYIAKKENKVQVVKVDSKNQLGDIFTKGLSAPTFEYLRRLLMGW